MKGNNIYVSLSFKGRAEGTAAAAGLVKDSLDKRSKLLDLLLKKS